MDYPELRHRILTFIPQVTMFFSISLIVLGSMCIDIDVNESISHLLPIIPVFMCATLERQVWYTKTDMLKLTWK